VTQSGGEERAEMLHRLAAGTVHDVNNLLVLVIGCAELALDDAALSPPTRQLLLEIAAVGERATSLTRQFLSLGGPVASPTSVVDVSAVLRSAAPLLGRMLGDRIALDLRLAASPQWVSADASQIEQIVMNLALNARDAMPGGGTLTIATPGEPLADPAAASVSSHPRRATTRVTVADTGEGIDPGIRERMYEPFVTTKGRGKGAGLGLAVVHAIVEQLGGTIDVASTPGLGTTFTIDLPIANDPAAGPTSA
jgi:two-component system, cell cycle sensor histidine kinase and response regulator CckA